MDQWSRDKSVEEGVARFLDRHFWGRFGKPVRRVEDVREQYAGVDVVAGGVRFDEKAKVRGCLNRVCEYPSFELEMTSRGGKRRDGWFFSAVSTDYYAFVSVSAGTDDERRLSDDGLISAVDVLWVKKSDVEDMAYSQESRERLRADARALSEEAPDGFGKARLRYSHGKFWLTYSDYLRERPVNMVVPRKTLEELPHSRRFVATRDKVELAGKGGKGGRP